MKSFFTLLFVAFIASITTALVLLVFVLPLYGVDLTGWGKKWGIVSSITQAESAKVSPLPTTIQNSKPNLAPLSTEATLQADPLAERSDTVQLTIPAKQTLDYRLAMERDYDLDYLWTANGVKVESALQGESKDGKISKTFAKLTNTSGKGFFIIPFEGQFGWHWVNPSNQPVTIRLTTTGHYTIIGEINK